MAYFSKLGINGKVIAVTPVNNNDILNADGIEDEEVGRQYLENVHGWPLWKKTSYNTLEGKYYIFNESGERVLGPDQTKAFRKNYGAIGYTYSELYDGFIQSKPPYTSWTLDTVKGVYVPPVTIEVPSVYMNESNVQKDIITQWDEANLRWTGKKNKTNESIDFIYNPSTKTWTSV